MIRKTKDGKYEYTDINYNHNDNDNDHTVSMKSMLIVLGMISILFVILSLIGDILYNEYSPQIYEDGYNGVDCSKYNDVYNKVCIEGRLRAIEDGKE